MLDMKNETDVEVLQRLLSARFSCRGFLPDTVDKGLIEKWLETAQRSPSWCNTQPWQLVVTSGEGTHAFINGLQKAMLNDKHAPDFLFPGTYEGVCLERRREVGFQLFDSVGIKKGDREASAKQTAENYRLFGAPHVALLTVPKSLGVYGAVDAGIYIGILLLAAQALGLGCIAQASLAGFPDFVRRHFALPDDRMVVCGVSFGYADHGHPINGFRSNRAQLAQVVQWVGH